MDELLTSIAAKKERLDAMRPVSREVLLTVQKSYDVDMTYTSNAIEGNTLTLRETAELIEHGITVGGKPLRDHLEAVDHYDAVLWMRELAAKDTPIDENTVRELHRRIVARSQPEIGGKLQQVSPPHRRFTCCLAKRGENSPIDAGLRGMACQSRTSTGHQL
jgi:Fic family protein